MNFEHTPGATPISPDAKKDLIPDLHTQEELNMWEAANIANAQKLWRRRSQRQFILNIKTLLRLHKSMFDVTWRWAGKFRSTELTLGIDWRQVQVATHDLCANVEWQIENEVYPADELAIRFHHRLVFIHPFQNGNGRHSRLATDLLLERMKCKRFSWRSTSLIAQSRVRDEYIAALKEADNGHFELLLQFARS